MGTSISKCPDIKETSFLADSCLSAMDTVKSFPHCVHGRRITIRGVRRTQIWKCPKIHFPPPITMNYKLPVHRPLNNYYLTLSAIFRKHRKVKPTHCILPEDQFHLQPPRHRTFSAIPHQANNLILPAVNL